MQSTIICEPVTVRIRGNALVAAEAYAAQEEITRSKFVAQAVYAELQRRNEAARASTSGGQDAR